MKRTFFLGLLCLLFSTGYSQSIVKYCPELEADSTIVHFWENHTSIVYVHTTSNEGYFLYETNSNPIFAAKIHPGVKINDFKILKDTVYYCGYFDNGGSLLGLVGFFDINDLFFNNGSSNYCIIQNILPDNTCRMSVPRRMDVYSLKGKTHIAMVGDMSDLDHPGAPDGATIEEAFYDGTHWHLTNMQNKNNTEYYTDITCTGPYVVAAARSRTGNACYIKAFYASGMFLWSPVYSGYITEIVDGTPIGNILVEALDTNAFAVGYYYNGSNFAGFTLKLAKVAPPIPSTFSVSSIFQTQCTTVVSYLPWRLNEMRYNRSLQHLYVLQDMDYPLHQTMTSTVFDYTINYPSLSTTSCKASWIGTHKLTDVDAYRTDGFHSTGKYSTPLSNTGDLLFFKKQVNADTVCSPEHTVTLKPTYPSLAVLTIDENAVSSAFQNSTSRISTNAVPIKHPIVETKK